MSKINSTTLNALRTLFGARTASRLFKQSRGRASHILEEARASYGAGWDAIRAVHALMEQAFLETPAAEIIDSPDSGGTVPESQTRWHRLRSLRDRAPKRPDTESLPSKRLHAERISQTSVYPREILKRALAVNCGRSPVRAPASEWASANPSRADEALTRALKESLALIDVCLIDHIVIGGDRHVSFAERGLL